MIPTSFILLKQFTLSRYGRIDMRSLAEFKGTSELMQVAYTAPRNNLESNLSIVFKMRLP